MKIEFASALVAYGLLLLAALSPYRGETLLRRAGYALLTLQIAPLAVLLRLPAALRPAEESSYIALGRFVAYLQWDALLQGLATALVLVPVLLQARKPRAWLAGLGALAMVAAWVWDVEPVGVAVYTKHVALFVGGVLLLRDRPLVAGVFALSAWGPALYVALGPSLSPGHAPLWFLDLANHALVPLLEACEEAATAERCLPAFELPARYWGAVAAHLPAVLALASLGAAALTMRLGAATAPQMARLRGAVPLLLLGFALPSPWATEVGIAAAALLAMFGGRRLFEGPLERSAGASVLVLILVALLPGLLWAVVLVGVAEALFDREPTRAPWRPAPRLGPSAAIVIALLAPQDAVYVGFGGTPHVDFDTRVVAIDETPWTPEGASCPDGQRVCSAAEWKAACGAEQLPPGLSDPETDCHLDRDAPAPPGSHELCFTPEGHRDMVGNRWEQVSGFTPAGVRAFKGGAPANGNPALWECDAVVYVFDVQLHRVDERWLATRCCR